jgi:uncharacterized membrane protein YphA (DoxX/SURF4 family)
MLTVHIAEVLLALIFLTGGLATLRQPEARVAQIARFRFPLAHVAVRVNAIGMMGAGLFLALGLFPQEAASVLLALLLPTTLFGHAFWLEQGQARQAQLAHFVKNLGLMGGLLLLTLIAHSQ